MQQEKVVIISSVSGGGKSSLIEKLIMKHHGLSLSITATTRAMRKYEQEGKHYFFYSQDEFMKKIEDGYFLEYAKVYNCYYGIPLENIQNTLSQGKSPILNIDVQGKKTVQKKLGKNQVMSFFLLPPSIKVWEERLRGRKSNTEEEIQKRLKEGQKEMEDAKSYDWNIINHTLDQAVREIEEILHSNKIISLQKG